MAYRVIVKKRFSNKVQKVLTWLETEWSHKVAVEFLIKIDRRINLLITQPDIAIPSTKVKDVRGLLITRHNRLYYRIKDDKVIVLCIIQELILVRTHINVQLKEIYRNYLPDRL